MGDLTHGIEHVAVEAETAYDDDPVEGAGCRAEEEQQK